MDAGRRVAGAFARAVTAGVGCGVVGLGYDAPGAAAGPGVRFERAGGIAVDDVGVTHGGSPCM